MKDFDVIRFKGSWNVVVCKTFITLDSSVLKDKPKLLYIVLKSYSNPSTEVAFPGQGLLCNILGWNKETLRKNLNELKRLGIIEIQQIRCDKGRFKKNVYTIFDEKNWLEVNEIDNKKSISI